MKIFRTLLFVLTGAAAAIGCRSGETRLIMPEKLFELPIGKTETDLAFFTDNRSPSLQNVRIKMRDGLIYVMDPGVNKLMEFNSYGEILTLWFDPELNPPPTLLKENAEPGKEVTKKAFAFPFHRITEFAVNSQKRIYIVDRRPFENAVVSTEYGVPLVCTVICFGKTGEAEYTLGQEGISGNPFPFITDISVDNRDCLNITCRTKNGSVFFKYDDNGTLLYKADFPDRSVPSVQKETVSRQGEILPAQTPSRIFIRTDVYTEHSDKTNSADFDFLKTVVWVRNLEKNKFEGYFNLPNTETKTVGSALSEEAVYPVMLSADGFDLHGNLFFSSIEEPGIERLLILNQFSQDIVTKRIFTGFEKILLMRRCVSPEGITVGIVFTEEKAEIYWWRTDL